MARLSYWRLWCVRSTDLAVAQDGHTLERRGHVQDGAFPCSVRSLTLDFRTFILNYCP